MLGSTRLCSSFRFLVSSSSVCRSSVCSASHWSRAVSDAEKVVGYPTSFLGLRNLLSDEVSNIAVYLKKLIGTGHPLLTTAKKLVYGKDEMAQTRGLIVLLVAKATAAPHGEKSDITSSQRGLAEITELIHTAHLIHEGVVELESKDSNLGYGNKMAILCGDFLLAQACTRLASLRNTKVVELVSKAIGDMTASEFCGLFSKANSFEETVEAWKKRNTLRYGSLLANSCKSAVLLSDETSGSHNIAYLFGLHFALAWQAHIEINLLKSTNGVALPVQQAAGNLPVLLSLLKSGKEVLNDQNSIQHLQHSSEPPAEAIELCNSYVNDAVNILLQFPESPARNALENITRALYC